MKLNFWALGKPHEPMWEEGIKEFTHRIQRYYTLSWHIFPPVKNAGQLSESELKKKESELILSALKPEDYLILLDEKGKILSSSELASFLSQRGLSGCKNLIFLIGGAFGVHTSIQQRAAFTWSFSKLTFPHQLVRLILAEQVYRACSINMNEKYHHD